MILDMEGYCIDYLLLDGGQNGGALVVDVDGKTLFHYVQKEAPDHASNEDLLKVNTDFLKQSCG